MPQRRGWPKTARLDVLVLSVQTGEPVPAEAPCVSLADALYRTRMKRRLAQIVVASRLKVDPATYLLWEGGKRGPHPNNWPAFWTSSGTIRYALKPFPIRSMLLGGATASAIKPSAS